MRQAAQRGRRRAKPKKLLADGTEPEKYIQRRILDWLRDTGLLHWRQNSGTVMAGYRRILLGEEGLPDIIVIVPPTGRVLGLEVKSANGSLRPAQKVMRDKMAAAGAIYRVVKSLQQAMEAVAEALGDNKCPNSLLN